MMKYTGIYLTTNKIAGISLLSVHCVCKTPAVKLQATILI